MTARERNLVREAIDRAMRAQLEAAGGYKSVELDLLGQDRRIRGDHGLAGRARALRDQGLSYHRIATLLRTSHGRVYGWCNPGYFAAKGRDSYQARKRLEAAS